jgi:pimeloyl-ACP methyl ester carboxylesterase
MQEERITVTGDGGVRLSGRVFDPPTPDAPGLLLHHGLASSQHIWDLMLPRLTRRFHVVTFDARGHGRSGKPTSGYGFEHVDADAIAVMQASGIRRPFMVGHSWGAMVALDLAARHPRSVRGAVLVDGGVTSMRDGMGDWATAKQRLAPPRLAGTPADAFRAMIPTFMKGKVEVTPQILDMVMSVMRVRPDGTIAPYLSRANHFRILRAIWGQDPAALYRTLRVPTLAVVARERGTGGDDARRRAVQQARRAARGRPLTVTWIESIHDVPVQHPQTLAGRIERFAAEVASKKA